MMKPITFNSHDWESATFLCLMIKFFKIKFSKSFVTIKKQTFLQSDRLEQKNQWLVKF